MTADARDLTGAEIPPKRHLGRNILLFLVSTCWFINGLIPIVPFGAIIGLALWRPRTGRTVLLVLIAAALGFAGTGLHVTFVTVNRTNLGTQCVSHARNLQAGIRLGAATIDYFRHRGKMVVYDDPSYKTEVDQANAYVAEFVQRYNADDPSFLLDSFVYQQGVTPQQVEGIFTTVRERGGDITSSTYLGYLAWVYPNQEQTDVTVVHRAAFAKNCGWGSIHFRLVFGPDGPKLTKLDFFDQDRRYRVVKGMKARNPFRQKN